MGTVRLCYRLRGYTIGHLRQAVNSYISKRDPPVPFIASYPISHPCQCSLIRVHISDGLRLPEVPMVSTPFVGIVGLLGHSARSYPCPFPSILALISRHQLPHTRRSDEWARRVQPRVRPRVRPRIRSSVQRWLSTTANSRECEYGDESHTQHQYRQRRVPAPSTSSPSAANASCIQ